MKDEGRKKKVEIKLLFKSHISIKEQDLRLFKPEIEPFSNVDQDLSLRVNFSEIVIFTGNSNPHHEQCQCLLIYQ